MTPRLKKCLFVISLIYTANAFATSFPYLGIQGGLGVANEGDGYSKHLETYSEQQLGNKTYTKDTGGAAGRIFVGYNVNKYFGFESGYTIFANNNYKYNNSTLTQILNIKVETYSIDLVGKFILPLGATNWNLYAKLGVAYVHDTISGEVQNIPGYSSASKNYSAICPAYGVGVAYNLNANFSLDLAWLGTYSNNRFNQSDLNPDTIKPVPTTNYFLVGIAYKFIQT